MPKQINETKTLSLHPTGATNTVNMTVGSQSYPLVNAYADADSNDYCRYTMSRSAEGYTNYTFTIPEIPSIAVINSVTARVRVYINNTSYVTNTICQLYTGTTAKGTNSTFNSTSNSNIEELTNTGTWTVAEVNELRLRIGGTGANNSNNKYIYFYGATVTIQYTVSGTAYTINASSSVNDITVDEASQDIFSGDSGTVTIHTPNDAEFNITDNGVNILNQLTLGNTSGSITAIPSSYTNLSNGITINSGYPITNAYNNSTQTSVYSRLDFNTSTTGYIELLFDFSEIPNDVTITSITANARLRVSSTSRMTNTNCQLYTGSTAKGSSITFSTTTATAYTLNVGSWTRNELSNLRMRIGATSSNSTSSKYIYVYGADITVAYQLNGKIYLYTISNINADHTILITNIGGNEALYIKKNGSWVNIIKVYKKINGSWTEQALSYLSDNNVQNLKPGT